ncbi:hypothetical protein BBC27_12085 [Acidithiobacillus ferrivorans]|uniref:Uncharacterized protein n=1 Tax=Acidithiobacillus ferrivorans TaxID=160808 RepID=A0A1B9BY63_9PROT|nr:hypothetical protein [Acidithiobacillus ferrivorans]OCB02656.1 hypothetical protein BBC27_12085 [Acidithiobacillus ferrivorans]
MNIDNMTSDDIEELEFMDRAAMAVLPVVMRIVGAINEDTEDGEDMFHSHGLNIGHICYVAADQMSKARRDMRAKKQRIANERMEERRREILKRMPAPITADGRPCTET